MIVGACLEAARGRLTKDDLVQAFERSDRSLKITVAPPEGLVLTGVYFPEKYNVSDL
jgi:tRNA U38,U39,U40 pseudouridine synthase TruA